MGETMPRSPANDLLEGEERDLRRELAKVVKDVDSWLDQPNDQLGGEKPRAFLGSTQRERTLRDLIRAIKHGMPT